MAASGPTTIPTPSVIPSGGTQDVSYNSRTHSQSHNDLWAEVTALWTKLGTGSSTSSNKTVLAGNGSGSTAFTASPTVSGSVTAETGVNVGTATGAAAGEVKASSKFTLTGKATSGDFTSDGTTQGIKGNICGSVTNGNTVTIDDYGSSSLVFLWDSGSGTATVVSMAGGANTVHLQGLSTSTWNVNSDGGTTWAVFHNGSNYVVKNRSGATRSFRALILG